MKIHRREAHGQSRIKRSPNYEFKTVLQRYTKGIDEFTYKVDDNEVITITGKKKISRLSGK